MTVILTQDWWRQVLRATRLGHERRNSRGRKWNLENLQCAVPGRSERHYVSADLLVESSSLPFSSLTFILEVNKLRSISARRLHFPLFHSS